MDELDSERKSKSALDKALRNKEAELRDNNVKLEEVSAYVMTHAGYKPPLTVHTGYKTGFQQKDQTQTGPKPHTHTHTDHKPSAYSTPLPLELKQI